MAKTVFSIKFTEPVKERKTWGFSPITRVVRDRTKYDRKRDKQAMRRGED